MVRFRNKLGVCIAEVFEQKFFDLDKLPVEISPLAEEVLEKLSQKFLNP